MTPQEEKIGKVVVKYEAAIKEVDVRLAVGGGDVGKGPKQQKTEITIYTLRNGVVSPAQHMHADARYIPASNCMLVHRWQPKGMM